MISKFSKRHNEFLHRQNNLELLLNKLNNAVFLNEDLNFYFDMIQFNDFSLDNIKKFKLPESNALIEALINKNINFYKNALINSNEVYAFKRLDETAGVPELENLKFHSNLQKIVNDLYEDFDNSKTYSISSIPLEFNKLTYYNLLDWLNELNIYVCTTDIDQYLNGKPIDCMFDSSFEFIKNNHIVQQASVIVIFDKQRINKSKMFWIIYHEIIHILDELSNDFVDYSDETYSLDDKSNLVSDEIFKVINYLNKNNCIHITLEELHDIAKFLLYYANYSECHAFMANIYGEIFNYIDEIKNLEWFKDKKDTSLINNFIINHAGPYAKNVKIFVEIVNNLIQYIPLETKNSFNKTYMPFIKKALNDKYKTITPLLKHFREIFNKQLSHINSHINHLKK